MIKIDSITKKYGKKIILSNISFSANAGDCIGIVGTNGSGKTTLLSSISGVIKPDSGAVYIDNEKISYSNTNISRYISYIPQENPLIPELSVKDNLKLWYSSSVLNLNYELENGVLKMLGIDSFIKMKVSKLSGGMKKRLSIGIALANNPSLLIMDEPSAALDLSCKKQIRDYMTSFTANEKKTIIIASHDESELAICNKLYLLKDSLLSPIDSSIKIEQLMELLSE